MGMITDAEKEQLLAAIQHDAANPGTSSAGVIEAILMAHPNEPGVIKELQELTHETAADVAKSLRPEGQHLFA